MEVLKLTPPFIYSYQCGATLLTSYIPIYMYIVSIQMIVDIIRVISILNVKSEMYSKFIQKYLPSTEIKVSKIISTAINNLVLLLTFGLSSPVLCVNICMGMILNENCLLILMGKLIFEDMVLNLEHGNDSDDHTGKKFYFFNILIFFIIQHYYP